MKSTRRSSNRQQKIPNHFHDSVHDLSKKKGATKNKDVVDGNYDSQKVASSHNVSTTMGKVIDDEGGEKLDNGGNVDVEKVVFGSVDDTMFAGDDGSNKVNIPTVSNSTPTAKANMSYAKAANKLVNLIDNKLINIPTDTDDLDNKFVIFDEELINDGSKRWQLTLCGFFVGFKMRINELRYNVRRMWSRYGLKDVIENDCGMFFFKFHHEEGMNFVLDNGPWMVNNKPLVVQKWDIHMEIDNIEPDKLPLWVRFCNPPLEALTVKGISALPSRIGRPLIMDASTTNMCNQNVGRISYARVLIEVSAKKGLPDKIDIVYKNATMETIGQKTMKVMYDWSPSVCCECGVFGDSVLGCHKNANGKILNKDGKAQLGDQKQDEFTEVTNKNKASRQNPNKSTKSWAKQKNTNNRSKPNSTPEESNIKDTLKGNENMNVNTPNKEIGKRNKQWITTDQDKRSANKYSVLENLNEEDEVCAMAGLAKDDRMESRMHDDYSNEEMEDVYHMEDGMSSSTKQDEVINLIATERLNVCVILETHLKSTMLDKDNYWMEFSSYQYDMLGWKEESYRRILIDIKSSLMVILGLLVVILMLLLIQMKILLEVLPLLMVEFKDCINQVEVEDLSSASLHFTWTKNLQKVKLGDYSGILKKLDRIMISEDFLNKYPQAHAIFLPYLISDHSPALLIIPNGMRSKKRSFKFANYITDKVDFCKIVKDRWKLDVGGLHMFNLVKKLKTFKHPLNNLNWSNGNLVEKVKVLKDDLKKIQTKIDVDPYDKNLRDKGKVVLEKYIAAVKDEEKLLFQKCKIKWLSYGDKNNSFFHKMLKGRSQRNIIQVIYDVDGQRYEDFFTTKLSPYEASQMVKPITDNEIKKAMFSIADNKAPGGPDGFSAKFFSSGKLLGELNATIISLIPKITTPMLVTDFRPIACCNVVYKCISKVIIVRIKGCLDKLINKNQSAFIPQDLMQGYNRVGGPKRVAFKIDIQNAYDTVSWDFMEQLLKHFGGRGLRQGDPMSPYLFTMVMEFFTLVMEKNVKNNPEFNYHFGCKDLKITHICFADDLMMFCHGDSVSVKVIKDSIEEFGKCSGLLPNFNKSNLPVRYLGVPLISKRIGIKDCSYWCCVFLLPKTVINDINRIMKNFLWSQSDDSKGKAKVAWKNVCKPKNQGGLGLKDLTVWNNTLLVKHLWNIANKKDTLWVKWVSTVKLKGVSIWVVQKEECDSWGWKNLLTIRDLIINHVLYRIGNGEDTFMWYDNWSGLGPLINNISHRIMYNARLQKESNVADMIADGSWINGSEWVNSVGLSTIHVPMIKQGEKDKIMWLDNSGNPTKFTMCKVYDDLRCHFQERLLTQDRIKMWGSYDMMVCGLCMMDEESHNHLFFQCEYSKAIWKKHQLMMGSNISSQYLSGFVSNILESFGCDCTLLVVFSVLLGLGRELDWIDERESQYSMVFGAHKVKNEALFSVLLGWKMMPSQACPISVLAEECFLFSAIVCISTCSMLLDRILL
ncbi:RNA-directed DNA polymerase, eukaryota, reverse transcriptase zinc-binding domain protein [Tanacetum coccineum]